MKRTRLKTNLDYNFNELYKMVKIRDENIYDKYLQ
jgi:hypothetical protein